MGEWHSAFAQSHTLIFICTLPPHRIIVFLLLVLGMNTEEAIDQFLFIWQAVYADETMDRAARSTKLEDVLKDLMRGKGVQENRVLSSWGSQESRCKG